MPARNYLIAANQRSGTHLLCRALADTGLAGVPDEYFLSVDEIAIPDMPTWEDGPFGLALGARDRADYVRLVREVATTPNGVFGVKVMANNLPWMAQKAQALPGFAGFGVIEVLQGLVPDPAVVLMTRRDRVAQAVSWARAAQDGVWVVEGDAPVGPTAEPAYDGELIGNLLGLIVDGEQQWRARCDELGVVPHEVVYEDLVAEDGWEATVGGVLAHLGLAVEPAALPAPRVRRQADALNRAWAERFLAENRRRGDGPG